MRNNSDITDILNDIIECARKYDVKVYIELMEPFFKYDGHGSIQNVDIPNIVNCLETDLNFYQNRLFYG